MESLCTHCGAPARAGIIVCEFCENPVDIEAAKHAIGCKKCSTLNVETAQQCLKCKEWLVVQCLFCNQVSRHDLPACASCREPFMGAAERKAAHDAQLRNQQMFNTAVAVAPLAGSLLGGLAGAVFGGSSVQHHHHSSPSYASGSNDTSSIREAFGGGEDGSSTRNAFASDDDNNQSPGSRGESIVESVAEMFGGDDDEEEGRRG